jgi:hypothetical protein
VTGVLRDGDVNGQLAFAAAGWRERGAASTLVADLLKKPAEGGASCDKKATDGLPQRGMAL